MNTIRVPIPRFISFIIELSMKMRVQKSEKPTCSREDPDTLLCDTLKNLDEARELLEKPSSTIIGEFHRIPFEIWKQELHSLTRRLGAYEMPEVLKDACCENDTPNPRMLLERSRQLFKEVKKFTNLKTEKDHENKIFQSPQLPLCGNGYHAAVQPECNTKKSG